MVVNGNQWHPPHMSTIPGDGRTPLHGNRWALAGTVLYFLEWVAIIAAGGMPTFLATDDPVSKVVHAYAGYENWYGWAAGWFSVVLLGRIVFAVAVRRSLVRDPDTRDDVPMLADIGVLAMTIGVVIEVSSYAIVAAAASLADHGASDSTLRTLDVVGRDLNMLLWGTTGVSVLCFAAAMWRDGRFPKVLNAIGVLVGAVLMASGLLFQAPRFFAVSQTVEALGALFWVWMIWAAVLLWRRTPARRPAAVSA